MDLFEEIRREYEFGLASISGVARKFGVHRRMVREAIESSIPMRLPAKERPRPTIGPLAGFIDEILEDDRRAPRKQRHTAHRIWVRITRERSSHPIAESTVRQYVRQRKRTLTNARARSSNATAACTPSRLATVATPVCAYAAPRALSASAARSWCADRSISTASSSCWTVT